MSIAPDLLAAYRRAQYVVFGKPDLVLRVGEKNPPLDHLVGWTGSSTAAYITAANPGSRQRGAAENEAAMAALEKELLRPDYTLERGEARDPEGMWPAEPSLLVVGITRYDAVALGRRLGQNAILFYETGGEPELVLLT